MLGKEDALFLPTCTMASQAAIKVLCRPGETLAPAMNTQVVTSEAGAPAALAMRAARPREKVFEDVRMGFVSPEHAARDYGVVVDPAPAAGSGDSARPRDGGV